MSDFFSDNKIGQFLIHVAATLFVGTLASGMMFAAANYALHLLSYDGEWKNLILIVAASFLPWYMWFGEVDKRPRSRWGKSNG